MAERTVLDSLNEALRLSLREDPRVVLLGETVWSGGASGVTRDLIDEFGPQRVIETPVSENAIFEAALGLAISGFRPIVEIYSADFLLAVANEVINDMAKWRAQQGTPEDLAITIRGPMGATGGLGPEHSQCIERYFYHAPGLEVLVPGTATSSGQLLAAAIQSNDPTLFLEHRKLYPVACSAESPGTPAKIGRGNIVRGGADATLVAWGWMVTECLAAADTLASRGVQVDVIDLRTIVPMDLDLIIESSTRTGRLVTVEEGPRRGGVGAEIVASVLERTSGSVATMRVGMEDDIHSYTPAVEAQMLPHADDVVKAVDELMGQVVA